MRSQIGAARNKLLAAGRTQAEVERDRKFKVVSRAAKERVQKYEAQRDIEKETQDFFDRVKFYPKSNEEQAMQRINRERKRQSE